MIIDYSTLRPSTLLLAGAGVTAVGRYLGYPPPDEEEDTRD